jgi:hypothetical protein
VPSYFTQLRDVVLISPGASVPDAPYLVMVFTPRLLKLTVDDVPVLALDVVKQPMLPGAYDVIAGDRVTT